MNQIYAYRNPAAPSQRCLKGATRKAFQSFADSIAMEMINDCFAGIFDGKSLPSDADREIAYTNLEEALATLFK